MARKKPKQKKKSINDELFQNALIDLIVGILLIIIDFVVNHLFG